MELLTIKEVGEFLKIKRVYDWLKRNPTFPAPYRLGKFLRWNKAEVVAWVETQR